MPKYKVTMVEQFEITKEVEANSPEEALVAQMDYKDYMKQLWETLHEVSSKVEEI